MSLEAAILQFEETVEAAKHGTSDAPPEGSTEWFMLRAAVLGLAYLKRARTLSLADDPPAAERLYREAIRTFKVAEA